MMSETLRIAGLISLLTVAATSRAGVIDFESESKWTIDPDVLQAESSSTLHAYADQGWRFTGGPANRTFKAEVDSRGPQSLDDYAWYLRGQTTSSGTNPKTEFLVTYTEAGIIDSVGFSVRRQDSSPSPIWTVNYSVDGGQNWSSALATINSPLLDNSNAWKPLNFTFDTPLDVGANQFVLRVKLTSGRPIYFDNFTFTIPEPTGLAAWGGLGAIACLARRRRRSPAPG